jgi:hypothetical protein
LCSDFRCTVYGVWRREHGIWGPFRPPRFGFMKEEAE